MGNLGEPCGTLAGKPVASNYGLLSVNGGLLWGLVACYFGLLGVPGREYLKLPAFLGPPSLKDSIIVGA